MEQTFTEYTKEARELIVNYINSLTWNNELRTSCEDLLIAYDQMKAKCDTFEWISVNDRLPEDDMSLIIKGDDINPEKTKKILVFTDMGSSFATFRLKMMVGDEKWVYFHEYSGETITHWMISPVDPDNE